MYVSYSCLCTFMCNTVYVILCRKVAAAVHYVMHAAVSSTYAEPLWLFAVPLYHFLSNTAKPFTKSSEINATSHQKNEWWGIAHFAKLVGDFKWMQRANM